MHIYISLEAHISFAISNPSEPIYSSDDEEHGPREIYMPMQGGGKQAAIYKLIIR